MRRGFVIKTIIFMLLLAALPGCMTVPLRRTTINQVATVHDIYQQQVLDNLAMFVHNRGSYPYFSLIGTGTTSLTDTATLADTNGWARNTAGSLLYATAGLNPSLMRAKMGSWATFPINDSVKLTVMRCVYQSALDGCDSSPGGSCPDCANLFYAYYNMEPPTRSSSIPYHGGPPNDPLDPSNTPYYSGTPTAAPAGSYAISTSIPFGSQDQYKGFTVQFRGAEAYTVESSTTSGSTTNPTTTLIVTQPLTVDRRTTPFELFQKTRLPIRGIGTPECLAFQQGWFCHGPKLPKHLDKGTPYGYYCGTYVWVPPGSIDQLTKLVLLIQDLAYYDPPLGANQSVTTQKTTNTPGPKANKTIELLTKLKQEQMSRKVDDPEYKRHQSVIDALQAIVDQPDGATHTTTTTTTTPRSRQPSSFQPSILQLQQDLNLLPPRQ